jgi:hypothetical protein
MTKKTKHTPGPWRYCKSRSGDEAVYGVMELDRADGSRLITVHTGNFFKRGCYSGEAAAEAEANARLIAAAPELLGELRRIKAALEDGEALTQEGIEDMHTIACVAIAKAEGK